MLSQLLRLLFRSDRCPWLSLGMLMTGLGVLQNTGLSLLQLRLTIVIVLLHLLLHSQCLLFDRVLLLQHGVLLGLHCRIDLLKMGLRRLV